MKKIWFGTLLLGLIASPAFAKGKPQGSKDHGKPEAHYDKDKHDKDKHDKDKGGKDWKDHDRDHRSSSDRPAGWDKGKKTGWDNCDVPPGQAKKEGCHSTGTHRVVTHRTATDPKSPTRRYPVRTTTSTKTTTTTTKTTAAKTGTHPFEPTLRKKEVENKERVDMQNQRD
jgi:hypothetical protein